MIDKEKLEHIAALAAIELDDAQKKRYAEDLNGIMTWIERLREAQDMIGEARDLDVQTRLAERQGDAVVNETPATIFANAPQRDDDFFVVPKVI